MQLTSGTVLQWMLWYGCVGMLQEKRIDGVLRICRLGQFTYFWEETSLLTWKWCLI